MSSIRSAITEIKRVDALAKRDQWVNHIHPLVHLLLTVFYIALVVSFNKYDIIGIAGMMIYPLALFILADLSFRDCLHRLRIVLPLVLIVGIFNPLLDTAPVAFFGVTIRAGWISMLTLMLKGFFSVMASYILVCVTPVESLCYALARLHVPQVITTQILLTYRYIYVLLDEAHRLMQAYSLRAPGQKGVHFRAWGTMVGQLLLRSMNRAETVYESMQLRGYNGTFSAFRVEAHLKDFLYLCIWAGLMLLFRWKPVLILIGNLFV